MSIRWGARRGNSVLEVVVMLATVLFILIIGVSALGLSMRDSLGRFAFFPESRSVSVRHTDSASRPTQFRRSIAAGLAADEFKQIWPWAGIGLCVALNLLLWLLLLRRLRKASRNNPPQGDEVPPQVEHARTFAQRQHIVRFLTADVMALFEGRLDIRQVMTTEFVSLSRDARPETAAEAIRAGEAKFGLVCDAEHRLLGIVRLSDLNGVTTGHVEQLMRRNVPTIPASASLIQALTFFLRCDSGCLPVLNNEKVVGLLTSMDAIVALQSTLQFLEKIGDRVKPALREHRGVSITEVALGQDASTPTESSAC